jgi:Fur family zinc uptake transcriptional regulator
MGEAVQSDAFEPATEAALDRADRLCAARGVRLTELRRRVLGLILDCDRPTGAYDLLDRLRATRHGAAPPTVYRALDFLREQGLVHRIERLSAFVGCVAPECDLDHAHDSHAAQFLICGACKRVTELDDHALEHAVADAAGRVGFRVGGATVEVEGVCADCAAR